MQSVTNAAHTEICSFLCTDLRDESECWEAPRLRELDSEGNLWPGWNHKGQIIDGPEIVEGYQHKDEMEPMDKPMGKPMETPMQTPMVKPVI